MEKLLTAVFYAFVIVEYFTFYYVFFGKRVQAIGRRSLGLLGAGAILIYGIRQDWGVGAEATPVFLLTGFIMCLLFHTTFLESVRLWLVAFVVLDIVEAIVDRLLAEVTGLQIVHRNIICVAGITLLIWMYYRIAGRRLNRGAFQLPTPVWVVLAGIIVLLAAMLSFFASVSVNASRIDTKNIGLLLVFGGGMAICILLFAMVYYFNVTQKYQTQTDLLEAQNEQQREYFQQLLQKEQDTRQFRHDLIAELLELKNYCEKEEYDKLDSYLSEMLGSISAIRDRQYDVGNDIVNTIINYYFQPIRNDCRISVKGYMKDELRISQRDLCIIVSNLVKNAVEAVGVISQKDKEIWFEVSQGKQYLRIQIKNTIDREIIYKKNGLPQTGKTDKKNHGLGLANVVSVVEKCEGTYKNIVEKGCYMAEVTLKI